MSLEVRLIRVAPLGGLGRNETVVEYVVTPHNLFDVMSAITRVAHEQMVAASADLNSSDRGTPSDHVVSAETKKMIAEDRQA